jgi:hypothetical protein
MVMKLTTILYEPCNPASPQESQIREPALSENPGHDKH